MIPIRTKGLDLRPYAVRIPIIRGFQKTGWDIVGLDLPRNEIKFKREERLKTFKLNRNEVNYLSGVSLDLLTGKNPKRFRK